MWRTPFVEFDLVKTNFNRVRRLFSNQRSYTRFSYNSALFRGGQKEQILRFAQDDKVGRYK